MSHEALRDYGYWDTDENTSARDDSFCIEESQHKVAKPSRAYSQRSLLIRQLRTRFARAVGDDDLVAPAEAARDSAESLINNLPEGCLDLRIAISSCGEINFFFDEKRSLFQVLFDDDGSVSYYGSFNGVELAGSDVSVAEFPFMRLMSLR